VAKVYEPRSLFESFLRWNDEKACGLSAVKVRVLPELSCPIESIQAALTVAIVPLVAAIDDFAFEALDSQSGLQKFRVSLRRPDEVEARARLAIAKAAEAACDVVLFPELCLTPAAQRGIGTAIRETSCRFGGRPWLVVAGSAHTPVQGAPGQFHNRAVLFDGAGTEWLGHNKLFRYEIQEYEQGRYGIVDALGQTPRVEDIVTFPRVLEILEAPMGRVAVLICEDLAVTHFVHSVVHGLEIDWLLVPVMDGAQNTHRWTASRAKDYASEYGTSVLVGTCSALVAAHRASENAAGRGDPGAGVGLLVRGGRVPEVHPLPQIGQAHDPVLHIITP
jgi:predicted amidohydrolase